MFMFIPPLVLVFPCKVVLVVVQIGGQLARPGSSDCLVWSVVPASNRHLFPSRLP